MAAASPAASTRRSPSARSAFIDNRAVGNVGGSGGRGGDGAGGAIELFNNGGGSTPLMATIADCTFAGNEALGGASGTGRKGGCAFGGAVRVLGGFDETPLFLTVTDSTFTGNRAIAATGGDGGDGGDSWGGAVENEPAPSPSATVSHRQPVHRRHRRVARRRRGRRGGRPLQRVRLHDDRHELPDRRQPGPGWRRRRRRQRRPEPRRRHLQRQRHPHGHRQQHHRQHGHGRRRRRRAATAAWAREGASTARPTFGIPAIVTVTGHQRSATTRPTGGAGVHGGNGRGGGLYLADTTACIVDSSIRDNEANGGDGVTDGYGKGGGIYIVGGAVWDQEHEDQGQQGLHQPRRRVRFLQPVTGARAGAAFDRAVLGTDPCGPARTESNEHYLKITDILGFRRHRIVSEPRRDSAR